ncbi:MAG: UDP-N-acetylmuramoyl-L-alanine--D-glutamate ligase [Verrucomicrobia bacterium]|nr:MAG: UDP-N-acetylmuramoyl-L-alanine--D-glutamate ligase [Verrucomicrobiota bacterium]
MKFFRKALVCGLGASGLAAARLLRREGTAVTALDSNDSSALRDKFQALEKEGARVLLGAAEIPVGDFEVAVLSPSIPLDSPWVKELRRRKIPLLAELELGWSRHRGKTIAVTGSNGKSTCVKWLAESLQAAGLRATPAGNYGVPVTRVVVEQPQLDWLVLEVSTFQLETCQQFRPDIGILLNIHPNHLDRHGNMATYTALKAHLFARTQPENFCLVHAPLGGSIRALAGGVGKWASFGLAADADWRFDAGRVWHGGRAVADLRGTCFDNEVLGQAGAAVMAALQAANVDVAHAVQMARVFQPLPHRMQLIAALKGVRWVNDSKATNLAALAAALRMTPGRVRLIAGGLIKEKDFGAVKDLLAQKVETVYLIGRAASTLAQAWSEVVSCRLSGTLAVAVAQAAAEARAGETVLLAPACASFDQFRNFEERGDLFADMVAALGQKMESAKGKGQE